MTTAKKKVFRIFDFLVLLQAIQASVRLWQASNQA
jgi:hypothetical protein